MRLFWHILEVLVNVFFSPADPELFGSRKRRKAKEKLAEEMKSMANKTQEEIDALKAVNPFESASAKSAMATSSRRAKQMQNRFGNMLGANATPESIIAAQGATQQAIGATAGDIATGAEANKLAQIGQLRGIKGAQQGQYANISTSAIDERGSGWNTLFQGVQALGGLAEGVGSVI